MELITVLGFLLVLFIVVFYALQYVINQQLDSRENYEESKECACNHKCASPDCQCPDIPCGPECKCRREDVLGF